MVNLKLYNKHFGDCYFGWASRCRCFSSFSCSYVQYGFFHFRWTLGSLFRFTTPVLKSNMWQDHNCRSLSNLHPTPSNHHERHQEAHHGGETCRFSRFWYWSTEHLANLWGTLGWLVGWKIVLGMIFFRWKKWKKLEVILSVGGRKHEKKTIKRGNMVMGFVWRYENVCKWSVEIQDSCNMYTYAYANIH